MTVSFNERVIETWWTLLDGLSKDHKLELASRLITSV